MFFLICFSGFLRQNGHETPRLFNQYRVNLNKRRKISIGFYAKPTALRLSLGFRVPILNHTKMALFTQTW